MKKSGHPESRQQIFLCLSMTWSGCGFVPLVNLANIICLFWIWRPWTWSKMATSPTLSANQQLNKIRCDAVRKCNVRTPRFCDQYSRSIWRRILMFAQKLSVPKTRQNCKDELIRYILNLISHSCDSYSCGQTDRNLIEYFLAEPARYIECAS